jgi:hypothetical protein
MEVPAPKEKSNSLFSAFLIYSYPPSTDWMMPKDIDEVRSSLLSSQFKSHFLPETPSQTYQKECFASYLDIPEHRQLDT